MKYLKLFESFLAESAKPKISYTQVDKKAYTTQSKGLEFSVKINGKEAKGFWKPRARYISDGVDVNELQGNDGSRFKIFKSGGTNKAYEISANLKELEKQPKDLSFTGPILDVSGLKGEFVSKITNAISQLNKEASELRSMGFSDDSPGKAELSKDFLEYFNLTD